MDHDDRQLLLATHRGHEASARLLWARQGPRLRAHARAIVRDAGAADDVVQTVLCRLLELPRSRVVAIDDVAAFLAAATRREALNALRSSRRETARRGAVGGRGEGSTAAGHGGVELDPAVDRALESLPRRLQEVVVLKHISDLTFDQIAIALATNRNTIASRYRSALQALRSVLEAAGGRELQDGAVRGPACVQGAAHA